MAQHAKKTRVLVDQYDLSTYFREASTPREADMAETTGFRPTGDAKTYLPGVRDGTAALDGLWDGAAAAVDAVLAVAIGADAGQVVTISRQGLSAVGQRAELLSARESSYEVSSALDEAVKVSAEFQADGGVDSGLVLHELVAETATGNGAGQDHTVSTLNGGVGHLHVTAAAGTTPTLDAKVQHSVDGTTWVDLITFAQRTAAGAERKTVAGTVNRHVRAIRTIGGTTPSFTFAVVFARFV